MSDLPKGWIEAPIGEICDVVGGATPKTAVPDYWNGDIPWLTPDDLSKDRSQYVHRGSRMITQQGFDASATRMVPKGTVLFTSRAPIGYVAIAAAPMCTNQGFKSFVPPPGVLSEYLYWYLRYSTPQIREMGSGTTFAEISKKVAASIPLPMPPTSEQRRIVDAIEEHFSRIEAGEFSLRSCVSRCLGLQTAVLEEAMSASWPPVQLGELLVSLKNGVFVSRPAADPPGLPILRISAVRPMALDLTDVRYAPVGTPKAESYCIEEGNLLFTRYSGNPDYVGACAVVQKTSGPIAYPDKLIRAVVDQARVDPRYIAIAVTAREGRREIEGYLKTTAGQVGIAGSQLKSVHIPLPPMEEQIRLINYVESAMSQVHRLTATVDEEMHHVASLRRSVLAEAFSGRLVPRDPNSEPASVLLERIQAEREASSDLKHRRKKVMA